MIIRAFRMMLNDGQAEEYRRRHEALWPELETLLLDAGVLDYRIFLDPESHHLYAMMQLDDDHQVDRLAEHAVMKRWWDHMADIMATRPDNAPEEVPLESMFTLTASSSAARQGE
ncbi:L-rhamnose mutarotase [Phytohalomonas tamaricis]|uniref:L-rhamnose mutarotase n=1 Tax=Phytohalomonas tamaricis TaxID=2081032 RepID=UPI000D0B9D2A|nr:L-rhamnose mutarotase [Phytohalomonas tamaricis]